MSQPPGYPPPPPSGPPAGGVPPIDPTAPQYSEPPTNYLAPPPPPPPQYQPESPYQPVPQYTAPQQGWPGGQPPYAVVAQPNTSVNGFAVASLILGICGGALLSVIFGAVALVQIKRNGGRGKGMAIAGLALSALCLLVIGILVAVALATGGTATDRDPVSGQVTEESSVSLANLSPGDCIESVAEDELRFSVPVVPCTEPHRSEVTAIETLSGDTYPGDEAVDEMSGNLCTDAAAAYAPTAMEAGELDVFYFPPNRTGWNRGDKTVICLVDDPAGDRTSSVAG